MLGMTSLFLVLFKGSFLVPLIFIGLIWLDFILKVFISPNASIIGRFVRLFLKKEPYWIGAVQKRFAWSIGVFISTAAFLCIVFQSGFFVDVAPFFQSAYDGIQVALKQDTFIKDQYQLMYTPMNPPMLLCILCLVFMWLEAVVGYCVGCAIYAWGVRKGFWKAYTGQNCTGGVCRI
jgi:hypothetical protein